MGHPDSKEAVLTPDLRVKGVRGLRVADVSVMPTQISGNIQSVAYMVIIIVVSNKLFYLA